MKPFKTLKPVGDQILVEQVEADEKTKGGIIIPEKYREKTLRAKVLAVGSGRLRKNGVRVPASVKPGDVVVIGAAAANDKPVNVGGKERLLIMEGDIFGVVE